MSEHDIWTRFRSSTSARIGLGRSGDGLPTAALLEFQLAHARARDAVHGSVDFASVAEKLAPLPTLQVHSQATDRTTYLRRPDLGRRLSEASHQLLKSKEADIVFVVADGLSAAAISDHAVPTLQACLRRLTDWTIGPVILANQARVALGDEIGEAIGTQMVAMLIGERPGLSVANSLGIYLTWHPTPGRKDSERNCISNIHATGLSYEAAAQKLAWLAREAKARQLTGISLKDNAEAPSILDPC